MTRQVWHVNEQQGDNYIKARPCRSYILVQVWAGKTSDAGDPDFEWEMPKVLGMPAAIDQAVLQSRK